MDYLWFLGFVFILEQRERKGERTQTPPELREEQNGSTPLASLLCQNNSPTYRETFPPPLPQIQIALRAFTAECLSTSSMLKMYLLCQ